MRIIAGLRNPTIALATFGVLAFALAAAAVAIDAPFRDVDTGGANAVTLELLDGSQSFAKVMVLENQMATASWGDRTVGIVPEWIDGSSTQLAIYEVAHLNEPQQSERRVQIVDLTDQATVSLAEAGRRIGQPGLEVRLLDVRLVNR